MAWTLVALCLLWLAFAYGGYALVLAALARRGAASPRTAEAAAAKASGPAPAISIVIAIHDGAGELAEKLKETLALDYPGEREILVASDASTDASDAIARAHADRGVQLVRNSERGGKEAAQALAIEAARGDVLVFTDVGAQLGHDALVHLVAPFADATVGSVSSEDRVDSEEGEGLYVRYEMAVRRLESRVTGLVGLSGSLFAARRELCTPWPAHLASDFRMGLETARRGLRAVCAPGAQVGIRTAADPGREWPRKVRTIRRGLAVLSANRDLLHPRWGRTALALWGHKVARFTSPFAAAGLLVASLFVIDTPLGSALLAAQLGAWGLAAAALASPAVAGFRPARLAGFFALVNAATLVAWSHHLRGERAVTWSPTRR